jgi:Mce-associated membrane protein
VPPPRRNANAQPPVRRPRVAGLRRPTPDVRPQDTPPGQESVSGRLPVEPAPTDKAVDQGPVDQGPVDQDVLAPEVIGAEPVDEAPVDEAPAPREVPASRPTPEPEPVTERKPVGERLAPVGRRLAALRPRTVLGPIVMILIAAVLTAAGFWFRGAAGQVLDSGSAGNKALTDTGATADVISQVTGDMQTVSSYKYTDLAGAQKAGQAVSTGKFLDDYNKLFEQVKAQAPAQKAVVTGQVAKIGVEQLQGDDAILLAFLTQTTTRADTNQSNSVGLVYTVNAHRVGGKWLISGLTPR